MSKWFDCNDNCFGYTNEKEIPDYTALKVAISVVVMAGVLVAFGFMIAKRPGQTSPVKTPTAHRHTYPRLYASVHRFSDGSRRVGYVDEDRMEVKYFLLDIDKHDGDGMVELVGEGATGSLPVWVVWKIDPEEKEAEMLESNDSLEKNELDISHHRYQDGKNGYKFEYVGRKYYTRDMDMGEVK